MTEYSGLIALVVSAVSSAFVIYRDWVTRRDAHILRASEKHLRAYEAIYLRTRQVAESLRDLRELNARLEDPGDALLRQVAAEAVNKVARYQKEVDWRWNPHMAYMPLSLENRCQRLSESLRAWSSMLRERESDTLTFFARGTLVENLRDRRDHLESQHDYDIKMDREAEIAFFVGGKPASGFRNAGISGFDTLSGVTLSPQFIDDSRLVALELFAQGLLKDLRRVLAY